MIVRHPHETNYTVIQNRTLTDCRLSWKARGLLGYLLSKPDGWVVIVGALVKEAPDGRAAVLSGLSELEEAGYLVRKGRTRGDNGRFDGSETEIHEVPPEAQVITTVRFSDRGSPADGSPADGKSAPIEELHQQVPKEKKEEDPLRGFDVFWDTYPRRDGSRHGKKPAQTQWAKLSLADKRAAYRGLEAYARSVGAFPKDAERYLKHRLWEDDNDGSAADPQTVNRQEVGYDPDKDPRVMELAARSQV